MHTGTNTQNCCPPTTCPSVCCCSSKSNLNPAALIVIRLLMLRLYFLACTGVNSNFGESNKYIQLLRMWDVVFPRVIWPFQDDRPQSGKKMEDLFIYWSERSHSLPHTQTHTFYFGPKGPACFALTCGHSFLSCICRRLGGNTFRSEGWNRNEV